MIRLEPTPALTVAESGDGADSPDAEWIEAGCYPSASLGFDHGLVVLAMGLPCWLVPGETGYRLLVTSESAAAVREQLANFDRESVGWPPAPAPEPLIAQRRHGWGGDLFLASCWALAVLVAYAAQAQWPAAVEAGALDARALFVAHEVWRPVTSLFLHADLGHLTSNLVGGIFLFATVFAGLGRSRGAWCLALAAVLANILSAALHFPGDYRSIGASTALFAALGLLTGRAGRLAMRSATTRPDGSRLLFAPLAAGAILLGLFGAGEARVDVLAHLCGFVVGLPVGWWAARTMAKPLAQN